MSLDAVLHVSLSILRGSCRTPSIFWNFNILWIPMYNKSYINHSFLICITTNVLLNFKVSKPLLGHLVFFPWVLLPALFIPYSYPICSIYILQQPLSLISPKSFLFPVPLSRKKWPIKNKIDTKSNQRCRHGTRV